MAADVTPYLNLLASQHRNQPKLKAALSAALQPLADGIATSESLQTLFDLDTARGEQLDFIGLWVGVTRFLSVPLENVYFSFGVPGLGWGQGTWKGPTDPSTGLVRLGNNAYRLLLRVRILNNQWDGTIPGAYEIWDTLFEDEDLRVFIEDHGDMSMSLGLLGFPDAVNEALFTGGYLNVKPAGIRMKSILTQSGAGPMFAFGLNTADFAGWGSGRWARVSHP